MSFEKSKFVVWRVKMGVGDRISAVADGGDKRGALKGTGANAANAPTLPTDNRIFT